ncbi:MAG: ATP-binding protein [Planctomycetota bacterium]|nr:ATP-binding protein [Planctomycetota bacterium]
MRNLWSFWAGITLGAGGAASLISMRVAEQWYAAGGLALMVAGGAALCWMLQAQLRRALQARRESEQHARTQADFLANMSHEIRTPLSSILGYAELLGEAADVSSAQQYAQAVHRNAEHLLVVVNDILDDAKIRAAGMSITPSDCDAAELIEQTAEMLRERALARRIDLRVHIDPAARQRVRLDPVRLRQIVLNLVSNAVKFTDRGEVCVTVTLNKAAAPQTLRVEVRDTGPGLSREQVASLFTSFYQADRTSSKRGQGTGLGLSISRRLAQLMGGTLEAASVPGKGSTFTLSIPAPRAPAAASMSGSPFDSTRLDLAGSSTAAPCDTALLRLRGARILIADDSSDARHLLTHQLTKAGADVEAVEDGKPAVERLLAAWAAGSPFDLALIDIHMPGTGGLDGVRQLRARNYTGRVIAISADALPEERARSFAAGFDDHICKPISGEELVRRCSAALAAPGTVALAA